MNQPVLRLLIQEKLAAGRLPHSHPPRFWSGPGNGETCDGCGETVARTQMLMRNLDPTGGGVRFHVACFRLWDVERQIHEHMPRARA